MCMYPRYSQRSVGHEEKYVLYSIKAFTANVYVCYFSPMFSLPMSLSHLTVICLRDTLQINRKIVVKIFFLL